MLENRGKCIPAAHLFAVRKLGNSVAVSVLVHMKFLQETIISIINTITMQLGHLHALSLMVLM